MSFKTTYTIDLDIALPLITVMLAITLTTLSLLMVPSYEVDELILENDILVSKVSSANKKIDSLTKELNSYRISISDIESAGASHTQAVQVLKAAELYHLDPKP